MVLHRLLARQLQKLGCDSQGCADWPGFLQLVNAAYLQADDDREMLERSLRVSSEEVMQVNAELRAIMSALRGSEEKYRAIFNNAPVGILQSTVDGRILDGNPFLARMLGYADPQSLLAGVSSLADDVYLHRGDRHALLEALLASPEGVAKEFEFRRRDGSPFTALINASLQLDEQGEPAFINCTAKDITERKQMEEQLLFRALHDPLTGLANRTLCLDRIVQANERALRRDGVHFAVVFIDLDRFKMINDSLGHEAGDLLLREIAQRLLVSTRKIDTVCRYGGDEFILVLEELSPAQVVQTIKRIRKSLSAPVFIGGQNICIEASFGVAHAPVPDNQPEDLLRNANIALHSAKQRGRDRVVVYRPRMHKAALQTMRLQGDMRRGLDLGEFSLVYQPIVSLETGRLSGFEALMRWEHPQWGMVRPSEFIPIAEKSGFIFELGQFAVEKACQDMAAVLRAQPEVARLTVSVNISPRQFSRWGLADQIEQAMAGHQLHPSALVLEITESSIMKYPEASAHMLARLKEKGMGIAIDDFGTGYSSMSALQKLPLDRLKIDMSFVSKITESEEDREIVRAIITLARSLHLKTVAEGIETSEQRLVLKKMGCDLGQGYLFSRPLPLAEAVLFIRQTPLKREVVAPLVSQPGF